MPNEINAPQKKNTGQIFYQMTAEEEKAEIERLRKETSLDEAAITGEYEKIGTDEGIEAGEKIGKVKAEEEIFVMLRKSGMSQDEINHLLS